MSIFIAIQWLSSNVHKNGEFLFVLIVVFMFAIVPCFSQESPVSPLVTDRPDFTESAETVTIGEVQIETGSTYSRSGCEVDKTFGEVLVRVGVLRDIELRLGLNSYVSSKCEERRLTGFEDFQGGIKIKLSDGNERIGSGIPALALIIATTLPTGSADFRSNGIQPELTLTSALDVTKNTSLSSNLIYSYLNENNRRYSLYGFSLSWGFSLTDRLGSYLEYYGFIPAAKDIPNSNYGNGGVTYLINSSFQLDARVGKGFNHGESDYFFGMGAACRF